MVQERLSDTEFGRHVRLQNRLRSQRQREKLVTSGQVPFTCWLPAITRDRVVGLARTLGVRINDVVAEALLAGLPSVEGQAPAPAPQEQPAAAPQEQAPADRAALAQLGHELLAGGLTAASIADQFNAKGWTPNKVPKAVGVKPRSDSPAAWTPKLISQLLLRDHPAQPDREAAP